MASTEQRAPRERRAAGRRTRPGIVAIGVTQAALLAEAAWSRLRPWPGWRWVGRAAAAVFVAALPVALVGSNLRLLFTAEPLYTFAVEQYDVPTVTGIPRPEIDRAMAEIRDYFTNDQHLLRITVTDERGRTNPLFTPREVIHMRDVKHLVQMVFQLQVAAIVYVAGFVAVQLLLERRRAWLGLARLTRIAMLGTLAVAVGVGVATLLGFDRLFDRFHRISFRNDFWQLDPMQDHLVQMFPFDFWLVATIILIGLTIVEVLALLALAWWYMQRQARRAATPETVESTPDQTEAVMPPSAP